MMFRAILTFSLFSEGVLGFTATNLSLSRSSLHVAAAGPSPEDVEKARLAIMDFESYKKTEDLERTIEVITSTFDSFKPDDGAAQDLEVAMSS